MCKFKSAIILEDMIYLGKSTSESHTDLLEELGIDDNSFSPKFVRVELIPPNEKEWWKPIEEWKFNRDQDFKPDWYFDEVEEPKLREEVKKWLELNKLFFNKDRNIGFYNTGDLNTGDRNTGNRNTGDWNTGDRNTGDRNIGSFNTGNRNTGDCNTGNRNTGDWNTGDLNTGYWNTGDLNTGDRNTGNRNTGDWNTGDRNIGDWNTGSFNECDFSTGFFNTKERPITIFNKDSGMSSKDFCKSIYYKAITSSFFELTEWFFYTDEEKENSPIRQAIGGYLKKYTYKEACSNWWSGLSDKNKKIIMSIPNFDAQIFEEITGIKVGEAIEDLEEEGE